MPFKSTKQKTYLAINEPDVYKKFKKEEKMMYDKPIKKKDGGGLYKKSKKEIKERLSEKKPKKSKSKKVMKPMPSPGLMGPTRKMGGKVTKRPMGGKVYKVDNEGQMMVQRMYGGKVKNEY